MFRWTKHIICILFCFFSAIVLAQSKEELQDKKEQLQNEIKLTNTLLNEAKKVKKHLHQYPFHFEAKNYHSR